MLGRINDPRFPEEIWAKMAYIHTCLDGTKMEVHYWLNFAITGEAMGGKIK